MEYRNKILNELSYKSNMGFQEMMEFYSKANEYQKKAFETLMHQEKFEEAWKFMQKTLNVALHEQEKIR